MVNCGEREDAGICFIQFKNCKEEKDIFMNVFKENQNKIDMGYVVEHKQVIYDIPLCHDDDDMFDSEKFQGQEEHIDEYDDVGAGSRS